MTEATSDSPTIRLLRETAAGPMSAVFVGEMETRVGPRRVAVKLLRELPEGGVERLLDLRDRGRRLAGLGHRHHAPVTDVARVDERFALIAPFVDGIDLLDWMDVLGETGRVLPRRVTCEILRCIAVALEAAERWRLPHEGRPVGLVHRDLKPSNVIIGRDGSLRVTDFGTGYTALAGRAARAGALKKGLVRYFSPERRDGHRATAASDVYALGILGAELFRGRWLRRLRTKNPAHDRQLADVVARLDDLQMRSDSDDRALRNLLLRMIAYDEEARPDLTEVVTTFRTLADRAEGPSLEAFAIAHAIPWMDEPPAHADEGLAGASATLVERGQPLPPARGDVPIITLPDRYELQVQASSPDTGEWSVEDFTDPRLRGTYGDDDDDDEDTAPPTAIPTSAAPAPAREAPAPATPIAAARRDVLPALLVDDLPAAIPRDEEGLAPLPRPERVEIEEVFVDGTLQSRAPSAYEPDQPTQEAPRAPTPDPVAPRAPPAAARPAPPGTRTSRGPSTWLLVVVIGGLLALTAAVLGAAIVFFTLVSTG